MEEKECQLIRPAVLTAGAFFSRDFLYFSGCSLYPQMGEVSSGPRQGSPESLIGTWAEINPSTCPWVFSASVPLSLGPSVGGDLVTPQTFMVACATTIYGAFTVFQVPCVGLLMLSHLIFAKISVSAKCCPLNVLKDGDLEQIRKLRLTAMR